MNIRPTRVVDLFLTYDCNCRCPYCFVKDRGNAVSLSPAVLDRLGGVGPRNILLLSPKVP